MRDGALVHLRAFGERVIFGVLDDRQVEGARVLERAAHDALDVTQRPSSQTATAPASLQVGHLGELSPFWPTVMAPMG